MQGAHKEVEISFANVLQVFLNHKVIYSVFFIVVFFLGLLFMPMNQVTYLIPVRLAHYDNLKEHKRVYLFKNYTIINQINEYVSPLVAHKMRIRVRDNEKSLSGVVFLYALAKRGQSKQFLAKANDIVSYLQHSQEKQITLIKQGLEFSLRSLQSQFKFNLHKMRVLQQQLQKMRAIKSDYKKDLALQIEKQDELLNVQKRILKLSSYHVYDAFAVRTLAPTEIIGKEVEVRTTNEDLISKILTILLLSFFLVLAVVWAIALYGKMAGKHVD